LGRIVIDSASGDGKLTKDSILFEGFGDSHSTKTQVVQLDVTHCDEAFHFFPGQIVALKGIHTHPKLIKVTSVYTSGVARPVEYTSANDRTKVDGLNIITACGPYCVEGSTSFELLVDDLVQVVKEKKPNAVILVCSALGGFLKCLSVFFLHNMLFFFGLFRWAHLLILLTPYWIH